MASPHISSGPDPRTPFEKFRDATRQILTTPKSAVVKNGQTKKHPKKK